MTILPKPLHPCTRTHTHLQVSAYFLSHNIIDLAWVVAAPALSLGVYYHLTLPRLTFAEFYPAGLFVSSSRSGHLHHYCVLYLVWFVWFEYSTALC